MREAPDAITVPALVEAGALYHALDCHHPLAPSRAVALQGVERITILGRGDPAAERRSAGPCLAVPREPGAGRCEDGAGVTLTRSAVGWIAASSERITINARSCDGGPVGIGDVLTWEDHVFLLGPRPEQPAVRALSQIDPRASVTTMNRRLGHELESLIRIAQSKVPVFICGDSGTGKEVVARAVHNHSGRRGEFVAINCAALSESIIHSQLFGHRRGSFSGAVDNQLGFVRASHGGTLFLDEIAELPLAAQAVLLRVLQESEVVPVGETRGVSVDLRVVSATNRDLEVRVRDGHFRHDLFARLNGYSITLPALRQRPEDVALLIGDIFRQKLGAETPVRLTARAATALLRYAWPLNIRELEQCLMTAVVLAGGSPIGLEHLSRPVRASAAFDEAPGSAPVASPSVETALMTVPRRSSRRRPRPDDDERRDLLLRLLAEHRGNISAVSAATGKARMQIHRWLVRYEIDHRKFRALDES